MSFPDGVRYIVTDGYPWLEFFDDENPNENDAPFIRQDVKPDGSEWVSVEEVTAYAEVCMANWRTPPAPKLVKEEIILEEPIVEA